MRIVSRLVLGAVCLVAVVALLGAGAVVFLVQSEAGNRMVRDRTEATIARLLGPNYASDLGEQSFEIGSDGTLAVVWRGVSVSRADRPDQPTAVEEISFSIRLLPLVGGGIELGRLEIQGARVDLDGLIEADPAAVDAGRLATSQLASLAVASLERQLGTLRALSFDTIAFRDIEIEGLPAMPGGKRSAHVDFAELRRSGGSALDLSSSLSLGALPLSLTGEARFEDGRLDDFLLRSSPVELGLVIPPGPEDDPDDERPFATDADIAVTLAMRRGESGLVSDLALRAGPGGIQMGRNRTRVEAAVLRLRHREGEDRVEIVESPIRFAGAGLTLTGLVEPEGESALRVELAAEEVYSSVAGREIGASLRARGTIDPPAARAELEDFSLLTEAGALTGKAILDLSAPQARTTLDLRGADLEAGTVKAFWPFNVGGRARRWVLEHVGDEGVARNFRVAIDIERQRFAAAFGPGGAPRPRELSLDLDLENADLATVGDLPRLYNANGRVSLRGSRTRIIAEDAMVEGLSAVALGASTVTFSRPRDGNLRDTLLSVEVEAAGSVPELLAIADAAPIRALRTLDFGPDDAAGTGLAKASADLRLGAEILPSEQLRDWAVEAQLVDATLGVAVSGRRFSNLSGTLDVRPGAARGSLSGLMDGMPAEIALALPLGASPTVDHLVEIDLEVEPQKALEIAPALTGLLDGPIAARLRQDGQGLHATLDLARTTLALPAVAWTKGRGVEAKLDVDVEQTGEEMRLRNLTIGGTGFSASGSAVVDGRGLRSARLDEVSLNPGDRVALTMNRHANGFSMEVEGSRFDARPLLQELKASAGRERPVDAAGQTFDIAARIDEVRGFGERALGGVSFNYASDAGRMAALSLEAQAGRAPLRVDISPRGSRQAISLSTGDLGAFMGFAGLYANIESGSALLDLTGTQDGRYQGQLRMSDFTIVDEPRLERLVGSEPVSGQGTLSQALGRDLRTSRAYFDQASATLFYGEGRLGVRDGILRGPIFGSSFEGILYDRESRIAITGSFMPAYTVNRLFGAIPLVGQILGNGNEGGLIGITYQLSGAFASPTLTVNPISLIAPGVFRQIFEY